MKLKWARLIGKT